MSAKLLGGRVGVHGAIGVERATRSGNTIRKKLDGVRMPAREPDRHHPRLDHARGRVGDAGHHRVGIARLDHQAGMEQRLRGEPAREFRRRRPGRAAGRAPRSGRARSARQRIAEQDRLRERLVAQATCRRHDPIVGPLGKDHLESAPADAHAGFCQNVHDLASLALRAPTPILPIAPHMLPAAGRDRIPTIATRTRAAGRSVPKGAASRRRSASDPKIRVPLLGVRCTAVHCSIGHNRTGNDVRQARREITHQWSRPCPKGKR